jgi:hypothetical protein
MFYWELGSTQMFLLRKNICVDWELGSRLKFLCTKILGAIWEFDWSFLQNSLLLMGNGSYAKVFAEQKLLRSLGNG